MEAKLRNKIRCVITVVDSPLEIALSKMSCSMSLLCQKRRKAISNPVPLQHALVKVTDRLIVPPLAQLRERLLPRLDYRLKDGYSTACKVLRMGQERRNEATRCVFSKTLLRYYTASGAQHSRFHEKRHQTKRNGVLHDTLREADRLVKIVFAST